jgi:hypothetical protein
LDFPDTSQQTSQAFFEKIKNESTEKSLDAPEVCYKTEEDYLDVIEIKTTAGESIYQKSDAENKILLIMIFAIGFTLIIPIAIRNYIIYRRSKIAVQEIESILKA